MLSIIQIKLAYQSVGFVVSNASSRVKGGVIAGILLASIGNPATGGPIILKLYMN
ncbi:MAG: hypothetical protein Q7J06_04440 [Bacteroidales bacterium]|nr:hypothetical protein [Bacteroidales bacterium]